VKEAGEANGDSGECIFIVPEDLADEEKEVKSVIDDKALAEKTFTAEYLYALNMCRHLAEENLDTIDRKEYQQRFIMARLEFEHLDSGTKELWEGKRRAHLLRQPAIKESIIDAIRKNPKISWSGIEAEIDFWCSASTIRKWVTSRKGYSLYAERIIPLLSPEQKRKHFEFANTSERAGVSEPASIYWFTMKWFWGMVMRQAAKMCEELGIDKHAFEAYHKNHINKCMGVAFTAFAFEDNMENGGEAIKLGFFRAQSYKVAEKLVRESVRQADGTMRQCGEIKRRKDDLYMVDCAVTGSNVGTATDPKFALKPLFEFHIFPKIAELVGPGGRFEGYTVIIQGDNAGPHSEADFLAFVQVHCALKGYHWEPQAP